MPLFIASTMIHSLYIPFWLDEPHLRDQWAASTQVLQLSVQSNVGYGTAILPILPFMNIYLYRYISWINESAVIKKFVTHMYRWSQQLCPWILRCRMLNESKWSDTDDTKLLISRWRIRVIVSVVHSIRWAFYVVFSVPFVTHHWQLLCRVPG